MDYGSDSLDGNGELPFSAMGTYRCDIGFAPEGGAGAMVTRTCSADTSSNSGGSFSGVEAVCVCK